MRILAVKYLQVLLEVVEDVMIDKPMDCEYMLGSRISTDCGKQYYNGYKDKGCR